MSTTVNKNEEQEGQEDQEAYNAGDAKHVKKKRRKRRFARHDELANLRSVLSTEAGREVVWRFIEQCGVFHSPPTHPQDTFRYVGRADIGRWVMAEVFEAHPEAYTLMRQEAEQREQN